MSFEQSATPWIERTSGWLFRWRVTYPTDGMNLETLHLSRIGARLAILMDRA